MKPSCHVFLVCILCLVYSTWNLAIETHHDLCSFFSANFEFYRNNFYPVHDHKRSSWEDGGLEVQCMDIVISFDLANSLLDGGSSSPNGPRPWNRKSTSRKKRAPSNTSLSRLTTLYFIISQRRQSQIQLGTRLTPICPRITCYCLQEHPVREKQQRLRRLLSSQLRNRSILCTIQYIFQLRLQWKQAQYLERTEVQTNARPPL